MADPKEMVFVSRGNKGTEFYRAGRRVWLSCAVALRFSLLLTFHAGFCLPSYLTHVWKKNCWHLLKEEERLYSRLLWQGCCNRAERLCSTLNRTMTSWYLQPRNRVKGISGWKITKRRHQGFRGIPSHWPIGIPDKDRTQTSKVGDKKKHWSEIKDEGGLSTVFCFVLFCFC